MNARYHRAPSPRYLIDYKQDISNGGEATTNGTNSKSAGRDLFLDGAGETGSRLRANGTGSGGGDLNGGLTHALTVNSGNTHVNVSTSLDIRSSTVPTRGRRDERDFRT